MCHLRGHWRSSLYNVLFFYTTRKSLRHVRFKKADTRCTMLKDVLIDGGNVHFFFFFLHYYKVLLLIHLFGFQCLNLKHLKIKYKGKKDIYNYKHDRAHCMQFLPSSQKTPVQMLKLMQVSDAADLGLLVLWEKREKSNPENSVHGQTQTRHSPSKTVQKIRSWWIKPRRICDIYGRSCQNTTLIVADKVGTVWPLAADL